MKYKYKTKRTCLSRFDGSIDETFSSSHGVEEEFCRGETGQIRVLDEALDSGP